MAATRTLLGVLAFGISAVCGFQGPCSYFHRLSGLRAVAADRISGSSGLFLSDHALPPALRSPDTLETRSV